MTWIALGGLVLVLLLVGARAFASATVEQVKVALAVLAAVLGVGLLAVLLLSGRGAQALWSLFLFGPILLRAWRSWQVARSFARGGRPSPGGASAVETATLSMWLDHDSQTMAGEVKRGRYAGRALGSLDLPELLDLLAECRAADPESVPLVEAWLDRVEPAWREAGAAPPPRSGPMTREEALAVLGLKPGATEAEIRAAHRRLMMSAHPDAGGSDWLAARLNEARDVLLGR
ncbi:MAG: hypothetical protein NZM27_07230 [Acetobacteraceae bacterium]|nr:hypothetical protein [Acetobacteraceae bacterium]MDW8399542.1 hypothetical protein [Acetobacteraceae bacterium]